MTKQESLANWIAAGGTVEQFEEYRQFIKSESDAVMKLGIVVMVDGKITPEGEKFFNEHD